MAPILAFNVQRLRFEVRKPYPLRLFHLASLLGCIEVYRIICKPNRNYRILYKWRPYSRTGRYIKVFGLIVGRPVFFRRNGSEWRLHDR